MSDTLRVLTVRNPWGTAIICGVTTATGGHDVKDVENRTRNIAGRYRGPVAIHVAARGHIIGVVDLVDVHHADDCWRGVALLDGTTHTEQCSPWAQPDCHHLVLANPRPLTSPIRATGRLGLWHPDADLEAAIWKQVDL